MIISNFQLWTEMVWLLTWKEHTTDHARDDKEEEGQDLEVGCQKKSTFSMRYALCWERSLNTVLGGKEIDSAGEPNDAQMLLKQEEYYRAKE